MPTLENRLTDPDREEAYRRGYLHGVAAAMSGLSHLLSEKDRQKVDVWFANTLSQWGTDRSLSQFLAPDFPKVGLNANPS
jgi:hypothetical protein